MSGTYLLRWLTAFLLTQTVEMGVYAQATRRSRPLRERLAIAFGASAITHPLVWFVIVDATRLLVHTGSAQKDWWVGVAIAESFAFSVEALWLMLFGVRLGPALGWSLFANGASFTIGLFLYQYLGW